MSEDIQLILDVEAQTVSVNDPDPSISVLWDRAIQEAATVNGPTGPTIASRAYGVLHTAIFDAWAQYDPDAIATTVGDEFQVPLDQVTDANKTEAISFAAYRTSVFLFPEQQQIFDDLMAELGFDPANTSVDPATPAGIGNAIAAEIIEFRSNDGSNQLGDVPFADTTGYEPANVGPTDLDDTGLVINDIARWTPEFNATLGGTQGFLTPQWGEVTPFALENGGAIRPPAPEPFLLDPNATADIQAQTITRADGTVVPISRDLIGVDINPGFITQTEEVIGFSANLTDEEKLIAEFWEDGGGTSFPPGTWMTFGQFVSARDENTIDEDVELFFALGNAVLDAGIATWEAKYFPEYDYTRPIRAVRELGRLGLIGEDSNGDGLFEVEATVRGEGVQVINAIDFETYQEPDGDPSPPFPEFTSGHSAFSRAAAEVLQAFTGSDEFNASVTFPEGSARFEPGITPAEETTLSWPTFTFAADEAGASRLFGGIHFEQGDLDGRELGRQAGLAAFDRAQFFIEGGDVAPTILVGTAGDDTAITGAAPEQIETDASEDTILTGAGDDLVELALAPLATAGNNIVLAGSGEDQISLTRGDIVSGGSGNDTIVAFESAGGNRASGGAGNDTFLLGTTDGLGDRFLGGEGDDTFIASSGGGNILSGGAGSDTFLVVDDAGSPVSANAIVDFEAGVDVLQIAASAFGEGDLSLEAGSSDIVLGGNTVASLAGVDVATLAVGTDIAFV